MIDEASAGLTRPGQAREVVEVYLLSVEKVARQSREALAVRSQQAPALSRKKFRIALANVNPEETETRHK